MTKKQILGCIMVYAGYALGCWGFYNIGKCQGAIEAYDECYKELNKADDSLREKYPGVFEEV